MLCVVMTRNVVFWLVVDGLTFFVIVVEFESFGEGLLLIFNFFDNIRKNFLEIYDLKI